MTHEGSGTMKELTDRQKQIAREAWINHSGRYHHAVYAAVEAVLADVPASEQRDGNEQVEWNSCYVSHTKDQVCSRGTYGCRANHPPSQPPAPQDARLVEPWRPSQKQCLEMEHIYRHTDETEEAWLAITEYVRARLTPAPVSLQDKVEATLRKNLRADVNTPQIDRIAAELIALVDAHYNAGLRLEIGEDVPNAK